MKKITNNSKQTKQIGRELVKRIKPGDVLLLYGDLGAGKTTFTQGVADGLGIKDRIISPTFVLQRIHDVKTGDISCLNHLDLYRLEEPTSTDSLGLVDLFEDHESITIIEWADRLRDFKPKNGFEISFKYISDDKREIEILEL